jgi:lauroyl/myristoyl acyltransferase/ADP-heptose:LPS heptosyltransferase
VYNITQTGWLYNQYAHKKLALFLPSLYEWSTVKFGAIGYSVVLSLLLRGFGFVVSRLPNNVIRGISVAIGTLAFYAMPVRRRITLSNLHHAFPDKNETWRVRVAKESFSRMIELGLLAASCRYLSEARITENFTASPTLLRMISNVRRSKRGALVLVPHVSMMESATMIPKIAGTDCPEVGVIYRPFDSKSFEKFIRKSRERFGIRLFSRKSGMIKAMKLLRDGGVVALLFDQNAGCSGHTTTFFSRCTQASALPGMLAKKYKVPVYCLYPDRIGTWKADLKMEKLCQSCQDPAELVAMANGWLEGKLCASESACADWLWAHDRWKITFDKPNILSINKSRSWLRSGKQSHKRKAFPKNLRVFVRMPNWLGDIVMAIPVLRALKNSRPDVGLTLLCQPQFVELLSQLGLAEEFIALPKRGMGYFFQFFKYRKLYPDIHIVFTHSLRSDIEAYVIGATVRMGMYFNGARPLLTDVFKFSPSFDGSSVHQTKILGAFLKTYGLRGGINYTPYKICLEIEPGRPFSHSIGVICGSSNDPSKRWPIGHWKILIERILSYYPGVQIRLYGTASDSELADKIVLGLGKYKIRQLCGVTTLIELGRSMQSDDLVISGDTGGIHIANMFGRPVVGIYGPTNSRRTGPIFNAAKTIVYPDGCPLGGGFPVCDVSVEQVLAAIAPIMNVAMPTQTPDSIAIKQDRA